MIGLIPQMEAFLKIRLSLQIDNKILFNSKIMKEGILIVVILGLNFANNLFCQTPFSFQNQKIAPGTKQHITVSLSDGTNEATIPITVFHGQEDGPILGITAGVHGYEYAPILAGQNLISKIDPGQLKGTIMLVQIANVPSFLGRSPYVNPNDNKNLNRTFPGSATGTITERVAHFISTEIIGRSDLFLDMHSGDAPEDLMPYIAYYQNDSLPEISEQGRQAASIMGFDHVILFKTTGKDYMKAGFPSLYCSAEAFKQGIPSVDIECGRLGMIEPTFVDQIVLGINKLLRHLDMYPGPDLKDQKVAYIDERTSMSSASTGFFYPLKASGNYVVKGMKIGYITDFFNQHLEDIHANRSGVILYMLGTPPVNKGETLYSIGVIKNE